MPEQRRRYASKNQTSKRVILLNDSAFRRACSLICVDMLCSGRTAGATRIAASARKSVVALYRNRLAG